MDEHEINHIPSGVQGRSSEVEMKIEKIEEGKYQVSCAGGQVVESKKATKRNRACFDADKCADWYKISYFWDFKIWVFRVDSTNIFQR